MNSKKRHFVWLNDLSIRRKLLLSFMALVIVPVLIIALRSYSVSRAVVEDKANRYSHDILYQTTKTMVARLSKVEDISFNIGFNREVQSALLGAAGGGLSLYSAAQTTTQIEEILSTHALYYNEINAIYIVSNGGYIYELDKTKQQYGLLESRRAEIDDGLGGVVWFGDLGNKNVVALTRVLNSTQTQKSMGYLLMYIDESFLRELLSSTYSVENGSIFLIDEDGSVIVGAGTEEDAPGAHRAVDMENQSDAYSFTTQTIDGQAQYVALGEPMSNGWRLATIVPVNNYQREVVDMRNAILLLTALVLLAAILCAWALSNSISRPIRRLLKPIDRFGQGDFSARCPTGGRDEAGQLAEAFNRMADNIEELIKKVYDEQLMKRDAELKSLQAQINPHFLYNTLETINWMARIHGVEDVGIMAKSLGDLMRATINGKDYVLLRDEIASLQNYLQIQKYRYGEKLTTVIDMAPDTEALYLPKLIIQPMVENAIYHGIDPSFENGTIRVSSRRVGGELQITVTDDCVGMTPEAIAEALDMNRAPEEKEHHSIGLKNVIKRIKTLFGDEYGIEIHSELGEGTEVLIRLPALTEPPAEQEKKDEQQKLDRG